MWPKMFTDSCPTPVFLAFACGGRHECVSLHAPTAIAIAVAVAVTSKVGSYSCVLSSCTRSNVSSCSPGQAAMSSPAVLTWSATEPMTLSLTAQKAHIPPNATRSILTAAQRYYAQPRTGSSFKIVTTPAHQPSVSPLGQHDLAKERQTLANEHDQENRGKAQGPSKKRPKTRGRPSAISGPALSLAGHAPIRQSPRLIEKRTAVLERMLRERLCANYAPPPTKSEKKTRRRTLETITGTLPTLSEDPAIYSSDKDDCRFHLPTTTEDRLAIHAALTPTLFRLQKKGWHGSVVWSPDASYMEAHQKCLQEYYKFESTKQPGLSPFELPVVLTLLPFHGKINDFRNSPNWPEGW
jgi:hypothetical protein